jgi:1-deoxy-D-xylulose-5-phosphate synthase
MIVSAPMNESELRNLMYTAQLPRKGKAFTIRYPRGQGVMPEWRTPMKAIPIGKGRMILEGEELAILTIGHIGNYAVTACEQLQKEHLYPAHFDMRFIKPLDEELLHNIFSRYNKILTVEDGCLQGGFGSAVLEFMADHNYNASVKRLGIQDKVFEHGQQIELQKESGFDPEAIAEAVMNMMVDRTAESYR